MTKKKTTRDYVAEFAKGLDEIRAFHKGERQLRTFEIPDVEPKALRQQFGLSQSDFAAILRFNRRTYERWEQGTAKPNPQAMMLLNLVRAYPDTIARIREIAPAKGARSPRATAKRSPAPTKRIGAARARKA